MRQTKEDPCTLGSYLSMVDPWYNCNIKGLGHMIPKLAKMVWDYMNNLHFKNY